MARKRKNKKKKKKSPLVEFEFSLPEETQRHIWGIIFFVLAALFSFSFFGRAGIAGSFLLTSFTLLMGKTIFILPLLLIIAGMAFFSADFKEIMRPCLLAILALVAGVSGTLEKMHPLTKEGGLIGQAITEPLLRFFGIWVTQILFAASIVIGIVVFWRLLKRDKEILHEDEEKEKKPSLLKKFFAPSFKVKSIEPVVNGKKEMEKEDAKEGKREPDLKPRKTRTPEDNAYEMPPIDLLEVSKGKPSAGDVKINSAVIKKTMESFDIPVEMSEVNIGPTVTQYSFKPAEGIKLSKITSLSNDLALALAAHPIRIEAPIPGKSLVGIEVPNKVRAFVKLKELILDNEFQNSSDDLMLCFGNDVAGDNIYTNLAKMPHLLVAGSTGTGKTIFLNNLIMSLLYKNSPDTLRLVLIDPKRVEFIVYNELPHLLCPVIVDSQRATNALKWLTEEMDRRFRTLAKAKSKNIIGYNEKAAEKETEPLPYIVVIIDELADLMAAKGREVESAIVRLAQMARAIGIHLIVATQRPSVEVITGLIKANITSRVTFQVASQVDSRTVLDTAGAEKLLGLGDMLFISNENIKPKRVQGAYISEKEVKKVVSWIKDKTEEYLADEAGTEIEEVKGNLTKALDESETESSDDASSSPFDDPLYDEAKQVVVTARRASASLLQRRLRVGYARAARLIDMLEGDKIIGPSKGARPREVFVSPEEESGSEDGVENAKEAENADDNGWKQV